MPRIRTMAKRLGDATATAAGAALRVVSFSGASIAGAILISYGLGEIYGPLLPISAGLFVLLADRKLVAGRKDR